MNFLDGIERWIFLIPLLPAIGALLNGMPWVMGSRHRKQTISWIACGTVFLSFLVSAAAVWKLSRMPGEDPHLTWVGWNWFSFQSEPKPFEVPFGLEVDHLSAVMILVVTGIGFLIHVYSTAYMGADAGYQKFMAWLNLFMFSMLVLVLGNNFLMMFIGWEGVGLCSYGLIGFWYHETPNANAAKKAFVVNRVGDFAFVTGLMALVWAAGDHGGFYSVVFREMKEHIAVYQSLQTTMTVAGIPLITFCTLCFFGGATGKSAQIPLYVWLPDAMAGPTPVSALIHAATMVTSGIYMITRLNFLFSLAPATLLVVCAVGSATALMAASIGLFQYDIKKVLAYSTVSQLGYMFMGLGAASYAAGMFHVFTHAFFKACLFLGSGSVIHSLHKALPHGMDAQDMRNMGGLRKYMPVTFLTFAIAVVAIAGLPPLAGFWSKDEILWQLFHRGQDASAPYHGWYFLFYAMGLAGAAMTAFYMTRQLVMTFFGEYRGNEAADKWLAAHPHGHGHGGGHGHDDDHHGHAMADDHVADPHGGAHGHQAGAAEDDLHAHDREPGHAEIKDPEESPFAITFPLMVLAAGSILVGFLGLGAWTGATNHWEHWFEPVIAKVGVLANVEETAPHLALGSLEFALALFSSLWAATFVWSGWLLYEEHPERPARMLATYGPGGAKANAFGGAFYRWAYNKYYVDELYEAWWVRGSKGLSWLASAFDSKVVDMFFNLLGWITLIVRWVVGTFDKLVVDGLLIEILIGRLTDTIGKGVRKAQTGDLQSYLRFIGYGALACTGLYFLIAHAKGY